MESLASPDIRKSLEGALGLLDLTTALHPQSEMLSSYSRVKLGIKLFALALCCFTILLLARTASRLLVHVWPNTATPQSVGDGADVDQPSSALDRSYRSRSEQNSALAIALFSLIAAFIAVTESL